jgi:NADH pyrophosphatase NudC (nudix superfamily)
MTDNNDNNKLAPAYHNMMMRVQASSDGKKSLLQRFEDAKEKSVELEELTKEEATRISDYIVRDLEDAAQFIVTTENALAEWMKFDLQVIEQGFLNMFSGMVDETRLELDNLAERAYYATEWQSGEIIGLGTLYCSDCGEKLIFHEPTVIPACPKCGGHQFKRELENT